MQITLPRFKDQFNLPTERIGFEDGFQLPYRVRDIGDKKVPCQQDQMSFGWGIAFLLGLFVGVASSFIHNGLWDTRGQKTTSDPLFGPEKNQCLITGGRNGSEKRGQSQRLQTLRLHMQDGCLMIESTEKVGPCVRNAGKSFDLKVA